MKYGAFFVYPAKGNSGQSETLSPTRILDFFYLMKTTNLHNSYLKSFIEEVNMMPPNMLTSCLYDVNFLSRRC